MANTSVRKARGLEQRMVEALQREEEDFIERLKVIPGEQTSFGGGAVGSSASPSGAIGEGIYLKKAGDVMLGPIAFDPEVLGIVAGVLDISKDLGRFKPRIIMAAEGGTSDDLDFIKGAANAGQLLHLQTVAGETITIKHDTSGNGSAGFNIRTPDGNDFVMNGLQTLPLIFDSIQNQWVFWNSSSGVGSGANIQLSNLDVSNTAINTNLIPDTNFQHDLGSALLSWASLWIASIRFDDNLSPPTSASPNRISTGELAGAPRMHFNVNDFVSSFEFYHLGVIGMSISKNAAGQELINPDIVTIGDSAQFQPKTSAPAINGVMALDGAAVDVRVFSGGSLRNFSDIVVGGSANKTLSNLNIPTNINQDLIPQSNKDLGSSLNSWQILWTAQINMDDFGSVPSEFSESGMSISDVAGIETVNFNVKSAGTLDSRFDFYFRGVIGGGLSKDVAGTIGMDADDYKVGLQLALQPVASNPAIDGIMRHVAGGDVKIFSGGNLRNFSQMAEKNLVQTITGFWTFTNSVNLIGPVTQIGDSSSDTVNILAELGTSLIPNVNNTIDIGSQGRFIRKVFIGNRLRIPVGSNLFD